MKLETPRLRLRPPVPADAEAYTAIHNSRFVLRYNAMQPTTPERMHARFQDSDYCEKTVILERKDSGAVIGAIFLEEDDLRYGVASKGMSYFIAEEYARRGFMKEAMGTVIAHLFAEEKLECICVRVFAPNTASRKLLQSLGFRENGCIPYCVKGYTGEIFDDVIHTLFPEDIR